MKYQILLVLSLFMVNFSTAQDFSMNQGGTNQTGYFSVIKFDIFHGFIIVSAKIKGDDYKFLLDTGAPNTICKALQAKLNLKVLSKIPVGDSNGTTDSTTVVEMTDIEFGGIAFKNIPTLILDSPLFVDCLQVDGIIGSNMLRNSIVHFSYGDSKLTLTDNIKQLDVSKKYASAMTLSAFQSLPYIWIKLKGAGNIKEKLLFDTGFKGFYDLSDKNYAFFKKREVCTIEAEGYGRSSMGIHGNGKDALLRRLKLFEMKVNGASFQNISVTTSKDDASKIGNHIFKFGNVTLDYKNKQFYFKSLAQEVDLTEKAFPINARFNDNKLFIGVIWDEKLRESIQIGDQIVAIDGVNCEKITICDAFTTKSIKAKESAKLTIKDKNGRVKDIIIQKK